MKPVMPKVGKYVNPSTHTVGKSLPISKAMDLILKHRLSHLPVLDQGRLVGLVSSRDLRRAASDKNSLELKVEDLMIPDPYRVDVSEDIDEVVQMMRRHDYEAAIVRDNDGGIVGVFTQDDALRAFHEMLRDIYASREDLAA